MKEFFKVFAFLATCAALFIAVQFLDVSALVADDEKRQVCPEIWILYEGEEWFVIDDEMWQAKGFDVAWTEKHCSVSPPTERSRTIR